MGNATENTGLRTDGYVIVDYEGGILSDEYGGATRYRSTSGSWTTLLKRVFDDARVLACVEEPTVEVTNGLAASRQLGDSQQDEGTEVCQAKVTEAYLWLKEKNPQYLNVEWDEDNANTMRRHGRQALARLVATRLAAEEEAGDLGRHELVAVEPRAI